MNDVTQYLADPHSELMAEVERNREAIAELVYALRPFAGMMIEAEHFDRCLDTQPVYAINGHGFNVGDLRKANAALDKYDTKKEST